MLKTLLPLIFSEKFFQKIIAILLLILLIYVFRGFVGLFLITFIFAYLSLEVAHFLYDSIATKSKYTPDSFWTTLKKSLSVNKIVTILYVIFLLVLIWLVINIFPQIAHEIERFVQQAPGIARDIERLLINFEDSTGIVIGAENIMADTLSQFNLETTSRSIIESIKNTSGILLQFGIGLIMSYIFIIDRTAVHLFFSRMKRGNFAFIYREFQYFSEKIIFGFGRVFKAQGIIAFVNAILTTI